MKNYKLGDIADIQTGPFGSQLHMSDYKQIGTPIITVEHLVDNKISHENLPLVGDSDKQRLKKYILQEGDIVFSRVGSVDRCAYVGKMENGWMFSGRCLRVRPQNKVVSSRFLSYYFGQENFKETIRRIAVGATMPSINTTILSEVDVCIPENSEQIKITNILSSLDDKIDLLNRQNKTLEALAETLFRQWFIEEAEVQSEKQKLLGDFIESVSITHKFPNDKIIFLNTSDIYLGEILNNQYSDVSTLPGQAKKTIKINDILFSEIRPANGRWAYIDFESEDYVISTKLMVLRSKGIIEQEFIYFYLTHPQTVEWLQVLAESRSGTFPQITFDQIKSLKVNIPSDAIMSATVEWCKVSLNKIHKNNRQIRTLTQLRDTLLPKLMSGEVRVEG